MKRPHAAHRWHTNSQHLVVLSASSEPDLLLLRLLLDDQGLMVTDFREPDLDNALTSIAVTHDPDRGTTAKDAQKALSHLPLAGKGVRT